MVAVAATLLVLSADRLDCPAAAAVEQKLAALRAPGASAPKYALEVGRSADAVLLTARDDSGALWLQRELPASAPCAELEDAAAAMLLAWEAQLEPGRVPEPVVAPVAAKLEAAAPAAPPLSLAVRVSAQAEMWLSTADPTWGAQGSVELHGRWLGVELSVLGQGQRTLALGLGRATWSRFTVALGPTVTVSPSERFAFSLGVGAAMGPMWVRGAGFDTAKALVDWDAGALFQARALLPGFWKLRPFVGATALWWLRRHLVEATNPDAAKVLPFFEATPTLGVVLTP